MTEQATDIDAGPFRPAESELEAAAKAIYDAVDPLSGDHIATVIHMSDHLFWDDRLPGHRNVDKQLAAVRIICRAAAAAALAAKQPN